MRKSLIVTALTGITLITTACSHPEPKQQAESTNIAESITSAESASEGSDAHVDMEYPDFDSMSSPVATAQSYVEQRYSFKPAEENPYDASLRTAKFWIDEERKIIESAPLGGDSRLNIRTSKWEKWAEDKSEIQGTFDLIDAMSIYSPDKNKKKYAVTGNVYQFLNTPGVPIGNSGNVIAKFTISFIMQQEESDPDVWKIKDLDSMWGDPAYSL